jgi:hypothetical protein
MKPSIPHDPGNARNDTLGSYGTDGDERLRDARARAAPLRARRRGFTAVDKPKDAVPV